MEKSPLQEGFKRGLLTVLCRVPRKGKHRHRKWRVRCECGATREVLGHNLTASGMNRTVTCGKSKCRQVFKKRREAKDPGLTTRAQAYAAEAERIGRQLDERRNRSEYTE